MNFLWTATGHPLIWTPLHRRLKIAEQQPSHENSESLIAATLAVLHASRKNPETFHLVRSRSSTSSSLPAIVRQKAEALAQIEETLRERRAAFSLATMELRDRVNATKPRVLNFLKKSRSGPVTKNITLSAGVDSARPTNSAQCTSGNPSRMCD